MATQTTEDLTYSNPYALVAGGDKGIGHAIAEALARRKYNLILIARHEERLLAVKSNLETTYGIEVSILVEDLSRQEAASEIAAWCVQHSIRLTMVCHVAGLGGTNDYLSLSLDEMRYMIRLNIESAVTLSYTLLPLLEKNSPSYILTVASMAGFAPIPAKNLYAATKAAVISFSYALRYQLKERNISVSCLCPGPVFTKPSIERDTIDKLGWFGKQMALLPEQVGEEAVRGTLNKKMIIIPGKLSKISAFVVRILPKRLIVLIYNGVGRDS